MDGPYVQSNKHECMQFPNCLSKNGPVRDKLHRERSKAGLERARGSIFKKYVHTMFKYVPAALSVCTIVPSNAVLEW